MVTANSLTIAALILASIASCLLMLCTMKRLRRERLLRLQERKLREELEAYAALDPAADPADPSGATAHHICALVAKCSAFQRVAMLMRDADSRLRVVSSVGVDEQTALDMNGWVARFARERRRPMAQADRFSSFPVTLDWTEARTTARQPDTSSCRQAIVLPLWSQSGEMLGALVVWPAADGIGALEATLRPSGPDRVTSTWVLLPLETLARKLERAAGLAQMSEHSARAGKMGEVAELVQGVARDLNNPLIAVLGFAELIVATSSEQRVREDAVAIAGQAMRMRDTVGSLLRFWRPAGEMDVPVDVEAMLRDLIETVEPKMKRRGVRLELETDGEACCVRGDEERLREAFEHLLNNAAQAVASRPADHRAISVAVKCVDENVRVVVTDSGMGFVEAARVFDALPALHGAVAGQGSGLTACSRIVHEHRGEISAFNVYPHGAAIVMELPVAKAAVELGDLQTAGKS